MTQFPAFPAPDNNEQSAIFLINVVHVEEGKQDAALAVLQEAVGYVSRTYPSFQWSRLYKSVDGKTVINQAQWKSRAEFESLFEDQQFLDRYLKLKETGTWEYHLYQVSDYIPAALQQPA
ncbi:antibiotic biosynthesis monooxygenase [Pseudomonas sp. M5]|uniref:antibiotic biosynthesis monooxygenase n=1 Tax=Pseudomonas sp. M5 TaxID=1620788 RepID=UPI0019583D30|nr:antibiotic biosynthesis monooxygenase [Pseudomonas sp. M5]MBM7396533.1 heme-degrading monooxygenase HmoA [Pseudomonas sp. M5]HDS1754481.1 antibiotic biosynthesis monooxygenase [Pseudomonas putida]